LLERIIRASSNENDIVLDPFCGCGTTLVVAHHAYEEAARARLEDGLDIVLVRVEEIEKYF